MARLDSVLLERLQSAALEFHTDYEKMTLEKLELTIKSLLAANDAANFDHPEVLKRWRKARSVLEQRGWEKDEDFVAWATSKHFVFFDLNYGRLRMCMNTDDITIILYMHLAFRGGVVCAIKEKS